MLDDSLNKMLENSIKKLLKLFRFFTLRFDYCDDDYTVVQDPVSQMKSKRQIFDELLSDKVFKMKCRAMLEFH